MAPSGSHEGGTGVQRTRKAALVGYFVLPHTDQGEAMAIPIRHNDAEGSRVEVEPNRQNLSQCAGPFLDGSTLQLQSSK